MARHALIFFVVAGVVVRRYRIKLPATGINHFIYRINVIIYTNVLQNISGNAGQLDDITVSKAAVFCLVNQFLGERPLLQLVLHVDDPLDLVKEPAVDFEHLIQSFHVHQFTAHHFRDTEDTFIVAGLHLLDQVLVVQVGHKRDVQTVALDLDGSQGFQQRALEGPANGHDLTGGFHLSTQVP